MQHDGGATEHRQGQQFAPAIPDQRAYEELCALFRARAREEWEEVAGLDICCEPVYNVVAVRVLEGIGATVILRVCMLGPFRVLCDRNPIPSSAWRSPQTHTILKMLLARRGHVVPADQLLEIFWETSGLPSLTGSSRRPSTQARQIVHCTSPACNSLPEEALKCWWAASSARG